MHFSMSLWQSIFSEIYAMVYQCVGTFLLYLFYRCIILYGKLDVTFILLRLRLEAVIYCSFATIVFVRYGIVAISRTMIINRQYFSQMGRSQWKKSLVNLILMFMCSRKGSTQKSEILMKVWFLRSNFLIRYISNKRFLNPEQAAVQLGQIMHTACIIGELNTMYFK